ncbi:MAG: chloride channel protein [Proteobacteria bacterium]|nr:chloride channel protein [Pseudomonadota bacterium]
MNLRRTNARRLLVWRRRIARNDMLVPAAVALIVGGIAAVAVIAFREAFQVVQMALLAAPAGRLFTAASALPWWWVVAVPALGGLGVGLFYRLLMPGGRPLGMAQVIAAGALRGGRMSLRQGIAAAAGSALSIGVGASVGREGPAVHLGASLAGFLANRLRFSPRLGRSVLGCGAAAAVAASFNVPIAGALFAHEVVIGHYALSAFAPIVIASVTGTAISRLYFGDFPAFTLPEYQLVSLLELPAFAMLGLVSGAVAIAFMRSVFVVEAVAVRMPLPVWVRPGAGGLLVGLIAAFFPQVLGVGYEATDLALKGAFPFALLAALVAAKTAATAISLGSGFGGGVFSPSLVIGAMLGGAFGVVATGIAPDLSSGPSAYALVGMGAVAGAVLGAPISTTLIIFEMTGDYTLTIVMMVAVVLASVVTARLRIPSFFHLQLERAGLNLREGRELNLLRARTVRSVMRKDCPVVNRGVRLPGVRAKLQGAPYGEVFATADDGRLIGTVTLADLGDAAFDTSMDDLLNAGDVARQNPPTLLAEETLEAALRLMEAEGEELVAVIDDRDRARLVGYVHEHDVMVAYNRALVETYREERGER